MTAEKYKRPPEFEAELAALPELSAPDFVDRVELASLEVVTIMRREVPGTVLRQQLDSILIERTTPLLRAAVRRHGGAPDGEHEDAEAEAMTRFWEEIQGESFFEVRFNLAMKRLAQRAGRSVRGGKQRSRERSALRIGPTDPEMPEGDSPPLDVADERDSYAHLEDRLLLDLVLPGLPDEQARALTLHYLMGLPIYSADPTVQTVASALGCAERKARQVIADGRAALRRRLEQEDGDE